MAELNRAGLVIDEFARECLDPEAGKHFRGADVVEILRQPA